MVKIAVLVSGGGTNLQALIDREQQGELGSGKICLVLSSRPDVYALERAKKAGIESIVVDRKQCSSPEQFSAKVLEQLQSRGIEMVVLAGFLSILCKDMVQAYPNILYISCNPETLCQNLETLSQTHNVSRLALFDQFPYTHHMECGVLLTKK